MWSDTVEIKKALEGIYAPGYQRNRVFFITEHNLAADMRFMTHYYRIFILSYPMAH
jgi:hypothetical protein